MDDVPAGPASPGPRRPSLSVVVPVRNGGSDFERCLRRLRDSTWTDYELIVVDDGSTDGSAALAQAMGADRGPARAAARDPPRPAISAPARPRLRSSSSSTPTSPSIPRPSPAAWRGSSPIPA